MENSYSFDYPEHQGNLFVLFANQHNGVGEIGAEAFKETLYMKMYREKFGKEPKKNPWEIDGYKFRMLEKDSPTIKRANEDFHDKKVDSVLVGAHVKGITYVGIDTFEDFVFVLKDNYVKIYKSKFKAFLQGSAVGLIGLAEAKLNGKRRQEKSITCDTMLTEDFLSNLSYNSYYINTEKHSMYDVEFKIKIGKEVFPCKIGYQPFLHLFLYFVKNGFKKNMTKNEIKKAILDEYVFGDGRESPEKITSSILPKKGRFG